MSTEKQGNKNSKWIILGSTIFILAILIAIGPIMVKRYMRTKWETPSYKYKTSKLLMKVSGQLQVSSDNVYYVKGDNGQFYVLDKLDQDLSEKINEACSVAGEFREAKNNEVIDNNPVRLFIDVKKITFPNDAEQTDQNDVAVEEQQEESVDTSFEEKSLKRAKLRVEANMRLNKPILFDVVKGKVSSEIRKDKKGTEYTAFILSDELGDSYMLYKKGKDLSALLDKDIVVLGREILPPSNMLIVMDETTFEIYEVYDVNYNKLM